MRPAFARIKTLFVADAPHDDGIDPLHRTFLSGVDNNGFSTTCWFESLSPGMMVIPRAS